MTRTKSEERPEPLVFVSRRGLALGWVAASPLFLFYELGLHLGSGGRNAAELVLGSLLELFGELAHPLRIGLLTVATLLALKVSLTESDAEPEGGESLSRTFLRQIAEGLLAAIALGPVLVFILGRLDLELEALGGENTGSASMALTTVGRLVGGAAWEELLFRVAVFSGLWYLVSRIAGFFALARGLVVPLAELAAFLGSALLFAALHLESVSRPLGFGGEPYDEALFLWRILAGLSLAALFRWRGFGVAAWCHGFFNFALALGVGPGVI